MEKHEWRLVSKMRVSSNLVQDCCIYKQLLKSDKRHSLDGLEVEKRKRFQAVQWISTGTRNCVFDRNLCGADIRIEKALSVSRSALPLLFPPVPKALHQHRHRLFADRPIFPLTHPRRFNSTMPTCFDNTSHLPDWRHLDTETRLHCKAVVTTGVTRGGPDGAHPSFFIFTHKCFN